MENANQLAQYVSVLKLPCTIAVIGISEDPKRPSFQVASYMRSHGYEIIPINPFLTEWQGIPAYPDIAQIPPTRRVDIVDIFRKSDAVPDIARATVARTGVRALWMQEEVIHESAATYARAHGLSVAMNICIKKAFIAIQNQRKNIYHI